jgi:hypothetical protein
MITSPMQPLHSAAEVLEQVHVNDKVLYMWDNCQCIGRVVGWRGIDWRETDGRPKQHKCLIYHYGVDRAVLLSDILGKLES